MAGGIGDLFGGIGSIAGAIINSGNQARANDIAEMNGFMQMMLGQRNIDVQSRLGTRNLDLQELFANKNFDLQKSNADRSFNLADTEGTRAYELAKSFGQQNLDLQKSVAEQITKSAKASKFDAYGNEVYYDPVTNSYKIRLAPDQQALMDANKLEEFRRSTLDQAQRRRGLDANEAMRNEAQDALQDAMTSMRYGKKPVDENELTQLLYSDARNTRDANIKAVKDALTTNAVRTNNTSSINEIGKQIRANGAQAFGSDLADARTKALTLATQVNNNDAQQKQGRVQLLSALSRYAEDPAMGQSPSFATTTQQADAGAGILSKALAGEAAGVGGALQNYGSTVGSALTSRGNAMINALTNGAAAQGSALTSGAAAQGNAINNLMSALSNAYSSQAAGIGSALSQQAKIAANSKFDLSGLGKIGSGLGGLFAAMSTAQGPGGGTTTINRVF